MNLRSLDRLDSWIENQILALSEARQIDEANVRLVRMENVSPAYQVQVHLVTPGPDVFAEGRDHTLRAAFAKVMRQLRTAITERSMKQIRKNRDNLSIPAMKSRHNRGT